MPTLEQQIASLTTAANGLTREVTGKMAAIDQKVAQAQIDFANLTPEKRITQTIHIGGDVNYLYPVWWSMKGNVFGVTRMLIHRGYYEDQGTPVASLIGMKDGVRIGSLLLELEGNMVVWGGEANFLHIKRYHERYNAQLCSHVRFAMVCDTANSSSAASLARSGLYLRGGGLTYHITHNGGVANFGFDDGSQGVNNLTVIYQDPTHHWAVKPIPIANIQPPVASVLPGFVAV